MEEKAPPGQLFDNVDVRENSTEEINNALFRLGLLFRKNNIGFLFPFRNFKFIKNGKSGKRSGGVVDGSITWTWDYTEFLFDAEFPFNKNEVERRLQLVYSLLGTQYFIYNEDQTKIFIPKSKVIVNLLENFDQTTFGERLKKFFAELATERKKGCR
ncbi:MAG: hypothetical protein R2879_00420 [Saprospiraceae bacterium]